MGSGKALKGSLLIFVALVGLGRGGDEPSYRGRGTSVIGTGGATSQGLTIQVGFEEIQGEDEIDDNEKRAMSYLIKEGFTGVETPVYEDDVVRGQWAACVHKESAESCFELGPLLDRLHFKIGGENVLLEEYDIKAPSVQVESATGPVKAEISSFEMEDSELSGWFMVSVDCRDAPGASARIVVTQQIKTGEVISFAWAKVCGKGPHPAVEMGIFLVGDEDGTALSGPRFEGYVPVETNPFAASPVYLMLRYPAAYLEFSQPKISSSNPAALSASVKGFTTGGMVSHSQAATIFISYDCRTNSTVDLTMQISIPPFEPIVGTWRRKCEVTHSDSTLPRDLVIDLANDLRTSVLRSNQVNEKFSNPERAREGIWQVSAQERRTMLRIASIGETPYQLGQIAAFSIDPRVVHVSYDNLGSVPNLVGPLGRELVIRTICKKAGSTNVVVTLSVVGYKPIEFGFQKNCRNPRVVERRALVTAGHMLTLIFLIAVFSTVALLKRVSGGQLSSFGPRKAEPGRLVTPIIDRV